MSAFTLETIIMKLSENFALRKWLADSYYFTEMLVITSALSKNINSNYSNVHKQNSFVHCENRAIEILQMTEYKRQMSVRYSPVSLLRHRIVGKGQLLTPHILCFQSVYDAFLKINIKFDAVSISVHCVL